MKDVKVNGFSEITEQEKMDVDGGGLFSAFACITAGSYIFYQIGNRIYRKFVRR